MNLPVEGKSSSVRGLLGPPPTRGAEGDGPARPIMTEEAMRFLNLRFEYIEDQNLYIVHYDYEYAVFSSYLDAKDFIDSYMEDSYDFHERAMKSFKKH